jgi:uncharacterized protein (DUF952 family)
LGRCNESWHLFPINKRKNSGSSFADQVEEVAGFVFAGSTEELVVLHLNIGNLALHSIEVRIEKASNGKSYPHIYGAIPCDLVDRISSARMNAEGRLLQG